jgi:aryl-alcohol dehydrogenase-like predicted oxidoreductase
MRYRTLGRTGLPVSEIGMGGIGAMGKYGAITPEEFAQTIVSLKER